MASKLKLNTTKRLKRYRRKKERAKLRWEKWNA